MKRIIYAKLVRDLIPDILVKKGKAFGHRFLSIPEYKQALREKLIEQAQELQEASEKADVTSELADVMEVVEAIRNLENISVEELAVARATKNERAGPFSRKICLEWTEDDGYEQQRRRP